MRVQKSQIRLFILSVLFLCATPVQNVSAEPVMAPSFLETDIQGAKQSPEQYRGKILVVYFWASWCPACRGEIKRMIEVHKFFHPKGVEFISVSLDQDLSKLQKIVEKHRIPYPVLFDGKGWENKIAELYGVSSLPTFFLINQHGEIQTSGNSASDLKEQLIVLT